MQWLSTAIGVDRNADTFFRLWGVSEESAVSRTTPTAATFSTAISARTTLVATGVENQKDVITFYLQDQAAYLGPRAAPERAHSLHRLLVHYPNP